MTMRCEPVPVRTRLRSKSERWTSVHDVASAWAPGLVLAGPDAHSQVETPRSDDEVRPNSRRSRARGSSPSPSTRAFTSSRPDRCRAVELALPRRQTERLDRDRATCGSPMANGGWPTAGTPWSRSIAGSTWTSSAGTADSARQRALPSPDRLALPVTTARDLAGRAAARGSRPPQPRCSPCQEAVAGSARPLIASLGRPVRTAASSSIPSTSRGPGRAHMPSASTACTSDAGG